MSSTHPLDKLASLAPGLQRLYHQLCPHWTATRTLSGLRCRLDINNHIMWIVKPENETLEVPTYEIMTQRWGAVWDVGANFGFFSLAAARAGNNVTAFDLSENALDLLKASAVLNNLKVTTVARPLTLQPVAYDPPSDSSCMNALSAAQGGSRQSIDYLEAERLHGTPNLIKMDIEGGEEAFLNSPEFLNWLKAKKISTLVELHNFTPELSRFGWARAELIDPRHLFIDAR